MRLCWVLPNIGATLFRLCFKRLAQQLVFRNSIHFPGFRQPEFFLKCRNRREGDLPRNLSMVPRSKPRDINDVCAVRNSKSDNITLPRAWCGSQPRIVVVFLKPGAAITFNAL